MHRHQSEARRYRCVAAGVAMAAWLMPIGGAHALTLVFQEGVGGYSGTVDTFLKQSAPGTAQGNGIVFEWDSDDPSGSNQDNIGLLRFDNVFGFGPNLVAPTDTITSAILTYEVVNTGNDADVREALVAWGESTTYDNFGGDAGAQSDEYSASSLGSAGGAIGTRTFDVTQSIAAWAVNPSANRGWIFLPTGNDGVEVRSREDGTATLRPKLTIVVNEGTPTASVVRGPYLQLATPTSIILRWRTDMPTDSVVRYGLDLLTMNNMATVGGSYTEHQVQLTSLSPNTRYYYSVGDTDGPLAGADASHAFYTPPLPGTQQPIHIWAMGDFGTADGAARQVRDAYYNFTGSTYTDLWLMLGDNAYSSGTDSEFQAAVFDIYQNILIQTAFWSTRGNHETNANVYYSIVNNPTAAEAGGLASGTEAYYSFDYGNAHFICLDSYVSSRAPGGAMMTWLASDIASTNRDWIIAYWHHPPYSKGSHDSDTESNLIDMRQYALPILEAGGVDFVLAGHSHGYERSFLLDSHYGLSTTLTPAMVLDNGSGREDGDGAYAKTAGPHAGAVYVVAGSGGALGSGPLNHPAMYISLQQRGSLVLDINGNRADAHMIRNDGVIADYFTVIKAGLGVPQVSAGGDQTIRLPTDTVNLDGTVIDDGLPNPPGMVTTLWTVESGPAADVFGDAGAVDTTATFPVEGLYVLRLTADDGEFTAYDELTVTVLPIRYRGDYDGDHDVDQEDYGQLQRCLESEGLPPDPGCGSISLDGDTDVAQSDLLIFLGCLSGPQQTPPIECTY